MSHNNAYIVGDEVILQNPYVSKNITIKHNSNGLDILFGSEVQFKYSTTHTEIIFGDFTIKKSANGSELVFNKGTQTLMKISSS